MTQSIARSRAAATSARWAPADSPYRHTGPPPVLRARLGAHAVEDVLQPGRALLVVQRDDAPAAPQQQVAGAAHEQLLRVRVVARPAARVDHDHRAARRATGRVGGDRRGNRRDHRDRLGLEQRKLDRRRRVGARCQRREQPEHPDERDKRNAGSPRNPVTRRGHAAFLGRPRHRHERQGARLDRRSRPDIRSSRRSQICARGRRPGAGRAAMIGAWSNITRTDSNSGAVSWERRAVLAGAR